MSRAISIAGVQLACGHWVSSRACAPSEVARRGRAQQGNCSARALRGWRHARAARRWAWERATIVRVCARRANGREQVSMWAVDLLSSTRCSLIAVTVSLQNCKRRIASRPTKNCMPSQQAASMPSGTPLKPQLAHSRVPRYTGAIVRKPCSYYDV
jgi:hypothetical protein